MKLMINRMTLLFIKLISRSARGMSLDVPPMECTYLSLFVILEQLIA